MTSVSRNTQPMKAYGKTGVYQLPYSNQIITLRLFECPEMLDQPGDDSAWVCFITYKNADTGIIERKETDYLTVAQRDHCREAAAKADPSYGELYVAEMAAAYWRLIA